MCAVRWKDVGRSWLIPATSRSVSADTQLHSPSQISIIYLYWAVFIPQWRIRNVKHILHISESWKLKSVRCVCCLAPQHHIKYQHLLKKKYVCPHPSCGRLFRLQKQLLRHAKHHTGTSASHKHTVKQKVSVPRSFYFHSNRISDCLVIADQRDYICEFCARAFKSSHNLAVHRMIHTGEKPLQWVLLHLSTGRGGFPKIITIIVGAVLDFNEAVVILPINFFIIVILLTLVIYILVIFSC